MDYQAAGLDLEPMSNPESLYRRYGGWGKEYSDEALVYSSHADTYICVATVDTVRDLTRMRLVCTEKRMRQPICKIHLQGHPSTKPANKRCKP